MKAILILDEMPEDCMKCIVNSDCDTHITSKGDCPLRPLPERKAEMDYLATGYNKCLDEIEGVDV